MGRIMDPYVFGSWRFEWFNPSQDLRPAIWLQQINVPTPDLDTLEPFLLSDPDNGITVRFRSLLGASGPPYTPVTQEVPFLPGSLLKFINVEEAEVDLRVTFTADTQQLLWAKLKPFPWMFNPLRGTGILQVTNPAGEVRQLNAVCISGFKLDESTLQEKSVEATLSFFANDPYWYSPWRTVPVNVQNNTIGYTPILPGRVIIPGESTAILQTTNDGDVNSFPVFILSGPYANPKLLNQTINDQPGNGNNLDFSANGGIRSQRIGQPPRANPLTINCINKSATVKGTGAPVPPLVSVINKLTRTSSFFPMIPGENTIILDVNDISSNTTIYTISRSAYSTMI